MNFNDRYTEVSIGPKDTLVAEALKEQNPQLEGATFNTGKYVDGKWVEGFHIEFEIYGESSESSEQTIIKIYNPRPRYPYMIFGEKSSIVVKSGYIDLYDVVFSGKVDKMSYTKSGVNRILELRCSEKQNDLIEMRVGGKTFRKYEKWSSVINWLIEQTEATLAFLPESRYDTLESDFQITTEKSIKGWLDDIVKRMKHKPEKFEELGDDNTWKWYISHGRIYVMPNTWANPSGIRISVQSGLYSLAPSTSQDSDEALMTLKMLLNPWITKQSLLLVEETSGMYKVFKYKFVSSSSEHITEVEATMVSSAKMQWISANKGIPMEIEDNLDYVEGYYEEAED
jgi:hypothetical protein